MPTLRTTTALPMALLLALAGLLVACGSDDDGTASDGGTDGGGDIQRLWIAPDLVDCEGVAPQTCMQVAESADGEYEYFYDQIKGFTFEEGTSYVIDVEVSEVEDPPADGSSLAYTLVEIIEQSRGG